MIIFIIVLKINFLLYTKVLSQNFEFFLNEVRKTEYADYGNVGVIIDGKKIKRAIIFTEGYDLKLRNKICQSLGYDSFFSFEDNKNFSSSLDLCFKLRYSKKQSIIIL